MTSASAPLKTKRKSNPFIKWTFRFLILLVTLFILALIAMNALNGTGENQKSSFENILSDIFKGKAFIGNLNQFSALPYVTLEIENAVVTDTDNLNKLLMNIEYLAFHTGLKNILLRKPIFRRFEIKNFYAAPNTLTEKAIIIDHMRPIEGSTEFVIKGQYSKTPFELKLDMDPIYEGITDLSYGFKMKDEFKAKAKINTLDASWTQINDKKGLLFSDIKIKENETALLEGKIRLASEPFIAASFSPDKAEITSELNYTPKNEKEGVNAQLTGFIRAKGLNLDQLGNEDSQIQMLLTSVSTIIEQINAPVDKIYAAKPTDSESAAPKSIFPDFGIKIDTSLVDLKVQDAIIGDVVLPISINQGSGLSIAPVSGQINSGKLTGKLQISEDDKGTLAYKQDLRLNQWDFGQFLTDIKINHSEVKGKATISTALNAEAKDSAELLKNLNGDIKFLAADAEMKSGIADKLAAGLVSALLPSLEESSVSKVNCVIGTFAVKEGVANVENLFVDTDRLQVVGEGEINIAGDAYDIKFSPEAKKTELLDITPSVRMSGPLAAPKFAPDALSLGSKIGGALLGVVNPVFLAASLTDFGLSDEHSCSQFIKQGEVEKKE